MSTSITQDQLNDSNGLDLPFEIDAFAASITDADREAMIAYHKRFPEEIAEALLNAGYIAIPLHKGGQGKDPTTTFKNMNLAKATYLAAGPYPGPRAGLVLDGLGGAPDLAVMDLDVAGLEAVMRSRLPPTPLEVTTGRVGGGRHLYYRRDPEARLRGSRTKLSTVGCDYKAYNGYVVAPGSVHRSGVTYKAYLNGVEVDPTTLTADIFASLPVLPYSLVATLIAEDVAAKAAQAAKEAKEEQAQKVGYFELEMGPVSSKAGKSLGFTKSGDARVRVDPDSAVIKHGPLQGFTVTQAASKLGPGRHSACCPHHEHNTDKGGGTAFILNVSDASVATHGWCFADQVHFFYRDQAREREVSKWALSDEVVKELHQKIKEEAKLIKAEREASEARYLASPKGKSDARHRQALIQSPDVLDQVKPEILAEDAARITAGVIADLSDPPAKEPLNFGQGGLPQSEFEAGFLEDMIGESAECPDYSLKSNIGTNPGILATPPATEPIPAHLVELALSRYRESGNSCKRGPTATQPGGQGFLRAFGLACWARTCEVCGPRRRRAERASIAGSVEALGSDWMMARMNSRPDEKNLRRWAGEGTNRVVLVVKLSPSEEVTLLSWAPEHGPEVRMSRRLEEARPVKDWANTLFNLIQEDVHPRERERAVRGTQWLCVQINGLKKELLRIKKRDPMAPSGGTLITAAKAKEVFRAVLNALGEDFYEGVVDDPDRAPKRGVQEIQIIKSPKGTFGTPDWQPGRPATPEELTAACDLAEIFKGGRKHKKSKDLTGYFDLDMSA